MLKPWQHPEVGLGEAFLPNPGDPLQGSADIAELSGPTAALRTRQPSAFSISKPL